MSRPYRGLTASRHPEVELRNDLMVVDEFLREVDASLGRLTRGDIPDSSGNSLGTVIDLSNYFYLPGKTGGATATQLDATLPALIFSGNTTATAEVLRVQGQETSSAENIDIFSVVDGVNRTFSVNQSGRTFIGSGGAVGAVRPTLGGQLVLYGDFVMSPSFTDSAPRIEIFCDDIGDSIDFRMTPNTGSGQYRFYTSTATDLTADIDGTLTIHPRTDTTVLTVRGKISHTAHLQDWSSSVPTVLSYIAADGSFNGPVGTSTLTGNSLIYNDPNTYSASGVSYSAASKTLTAAGQFGSSVIGQYVFGPDIPVGAVVVTRTNNDVTLDVFPTGTQAAALVFYGFGQFWKHRTLNRFWKLAGDTEADTVTTYSINRTSANYNPVIPTLDYANAFTKGQKITAGAGQYGMNVIPDGTTDAFRSESGGGTAWFRVTYDGRVISTLPDSWAGNGPGTSAITHTVNATSNFNVVWPDTAGYISISPTPTETLNTSATFGPTTLITTTGATYIRLVAILSVRTAQAGKKATLTFNWNDGVAARSAAIIDLDMTLVTEFSSFETVVALGAGQSLTNTLSYSVAPTTGKVDVRVIITRIYG